MTFFERGYISFSVTRTFFEHDLDFFGETMIFSRGGGLLDILVGRGWCIEVVYSKMGEHRHAPPPPFFICKTKGDAPAAVNFVY